MFYCTHQFFFIHFKWGLYHMSSRAIIKAILIFFQFHHIPQINIGLFSIHYGPFLFFHTLFLLAELLSVNISATQILFSSFFNQKKPIKLLYFFPKLFIYSTKSFFFQIFNFQIVFNCFFSKSKSEFIQIINTGYINSYFEKSWFEMR